MMMMMASIKEEVKRNITNDEIK